MDKRIFIRAAGLLCLLCTSAIPALQAQVVVKTKPQPPVAVSELKASAPGPHTFWVDGCWKWDTGLRKYIWVPGHFMKAKKNHIWVPGHWRDLESGVVWVPGHWAKAKP